MIFTERIRPAYVVDAHALIWHTLRDKKLGHHAFIIFTAAEHGQTQLVISAIVVAELFYANSKWQFFGDFASFYTDLLAKPYLQFVPFSHRDVLDFALDQAVLEMHDRIIVGLARRLSVPLITSDPQIKAAGLVEIVW